MSTSGHDTVAELTCVRDGLRAQVEMLTREVERMRRVCEAAQALVESDQAYTMPDRVRALRRALRGEL